MAAGDYRRADGIFVAYKGMLPQGVASIAGAYIVVAYMIMACIVMAYIVMARIAMAIYGTLMTSLSPYRRP